MDPILGYIVTGFGFVLAALSFAVIFRGRRLPGDRGSSQELEFKGFKVRTDAVVMLLVVSVIVTVLPLSLQGWLAARNADRPAAPSSAAAPPSDVHIYINGEVLDVNGRRVEGAVVTVENIGAGASAAKIERRTDASGAFDFPELTFKPGDKYRLIASKPNHVEQYFYIGPGGAIGVKAVLLAKGSGGTP
jgi:hypothetical protein